MACGPIIGNIALDDLYSLTTMFWRLGELYTSPTFKKISESDILVM